MTDKTGSLEGIDVGRGMVWKYSRGGWGYWHRCMEYAGMWDVKYTHQNAMLALCQHMLHCPGADREE